MTETASRPNVVMIVFDDMGFADFGCYGSPIDTPVIDGLARDGLRYNAFHVTPLCSPSRACLLTGRNHHAVDMGFLADAPTDVPGYRASLPDSAGTLARVLRDAGYGTFAVGKWHLAPREQFSPAGPFGGWPLGKGFDRFYGFLHGVGDQWVPDLVRDNSHIDQPLAPEDGYHFTDDITTESIRMIADQRHADPDKPFFLYFAPGATHYPHQAPSEWIEAHRGRFDGGWDAERERRFSRQKDLGVIPAEATLTPRPPWVPAWDQLSHDEQIVFARQMETYAGFLAHTDAQIGRLVEFLELAEVLDDTIFLIVADNGADGASNIGRLDFEDEGDIGSMLARLDDFGGFGTDNHYAAGWAWASNTPFRLWKFYTWLGGIRVPLVMHWPAGIAAESRGGIRGQFVHAIDLMPTILDIAGVRPPATIDGVLQQPIDGASIASTLNEAAAPDPRVSQYFEMTGSRSMYADGWKATTDHVIAGQEHSGGGSESFDTDRWALFDLRSDYSEMYDVSSEHPARVRHLVDLWETEADRNNVYPLNDGYMRPLPDEAPPFGMTTRPRNRYVCFPGTAAIEMPGIFAGSFGMAIELDVPGAGVDGVLGAVYGRFASWYRPRSVFAVYALAGDLVAVYQDGSERQRLIVGELPVGRSTVRVDYEVGDPERGTLAFVVGDREVAVERTGAGSTVARSNLLLVGRDRGFATPDYRPPFPFSGTVRRLTVDFSGRASLDPG